MVVMVKNSIDINNHISPKNFKHLKKIQVLAWDKHKNMAGLNR